MGRRALGALALVVVAAAAGCSDDDSSYTADADAICAPVVAKYGALLRQGRASPATRSKALRRMIRERGAAVSDLRKLMPPQEKRGKFERMLRYFDESQRLLHKGDQSFGESEEAPLPADIRGSGGRQGAGHRP